MDDGDDMDLSLDGTTSKRACDSCRTRKIRCDRVVPCSNCKASKLTCTTTAPTQKTQRQRVHISEEYEKKIDRIEDRLAGIENVLESLATKLGNLDLRRGTTDDSPPSRSSRTVAGRSPAAMAEAATPAPFEGETTMVVQSDYARELLTQAVSNTPGVGQSEEVRAALQALSELVAHQGEGPAPATAGNSELIDRSLSEVNPENLEKPPWEVVRYVLDKATKYPTTALAIIFPFLEMSNLREAVEDAYHNPGLCPAARRMLAYGVLHSLFEEFTSFPLKGMDPDTYRRYVTQCKVQVEVSMAQLDIFMPASYDNIMALLLGSATAIEMCKPSLCWVMTSMAASLCQSLGYHRWQTMKDDPVEERNKKVHIFWMIYMFDKTMSLRMGRASVIQDWDISLPYFTEAMVTPGGPDGKEMLAYWIKVARVQGQTYEKLFSPAAFLRSAEERARTAVDLVNAMNQAWFERGDARATDLSPIVTTAQKGAKTVNSSPNETEIPSRRKRPVQDFGTTISASQYMRATLDRVEDVFFHADVVMHYSTCSLIQRAISPDNVTFNQECLESSRAALMAHQRCNAQFNVKGNEELYNGYIHWSILQAPFTPFIVIFCNAIQNTDPTDLPSLQEFVDSLESCRALSEGADRLYKMCRLFLQIAKLYLQAKTQTVAIPSQTFSPTQPNYYTTADGNNLDVNSMTQFDPYLSALGLMPNSAWPMAGFNPQGAPGVDTFPQGQDLNGFPGIETAGSSMPPNNQNVQDWFSGSRYLMNLMEAGDDSQMPDLNF
ncbi:fungal-specific transcription factor domain-containing protein [Paraphoma chrysanthemicola]|nr:fungal-specific transcription factor domain-containing protein [Paraphoma chrysanthemicola]